VAREGEDDEQQAPGREHPYRGIPKRWCPEAARPAAERQLAIGGIGVDRDRVAETCRGATAAQPAAAPPAPAPVSGKRPNILVIFGDDIGQSNISAYTFGLMGYRTPNVDRIAREGMMFTDYYAEQSCTAGRSSFITGHATLRTGLSKVGIPGAAIGLQAGDITIAESLKPLGYATGQFGKNHLGDRNEFLPTVHGFDEFFGNLYHLNDARTCGMPDNEYGDGMVEHDGDVGKLLKTLDLGIANDTIVVYTTDNGPHMNSWPDAAMTPFRSEKDTNWEGASGSRQWCAGPAISSREASRTRSFRAMTGSRPCSPWPATRGQRSPFKRLAGRGPNLQGASRRLQPATLPDRPAGKIGTARVLSISTMTARSSPCASITGSWCLPSRKTQGTLDIWGEAFTFRRLPLFFNLRMDPYERAEITSNSYYAWTIHKAYLLMAGQAIVAAFIGTFKEFPPRQRPQSFSVDQIMEKLQQPAND
jgi:hypothetical protein